VFFLSVCSCIFGQIDSIKISSSGLNRCDIKTNLNSATEYARAIKWINATYKNPESVIIGDIKNKSITISGFSDNAFQIKSMGIVQSYNLTYNILISIKDSLVIFDFLPNQYKCNGIVMQPTKLDLSAWYKSDGSYKEKLGNTGKPTLEITINSLLFSFIEKLLDNSMSSDEALQELKKSKDKLDFGIITQLEYDAIKLELIKYIK
jgi:hypothetical protein